MSRSRKKVGSSNCSNKFFKKGQNKQSRVDCRTRLTREDYDSFYFNCLSTHKFHGFWKNDFYSDFEKPNLEKEIEELIHYRNIGRREFDPKISYYRQLRRFRK